MSSVSPKRCFAEGASSVRGLQSAVRCSDTQREALSCRSDVARERPWCCSSTLPLHRCMSAPFHPCPVRSSSAARAADSLAAPKSPSRCHFGSRAVPPRGRSSKLSLIRARAARALPAAHAPAQAACRDAESWAGRADAAGRFNARESASTRR